MSGGAPAAAIVVEGLRVARGGRRVLDGVDLEVARGAVTALVGPSGCGKTTLMRSIVGVQRVAGGRVEVLGRPAGSPALRRRVGYVTQAPSVYADLTVEEDLRYFAAVAGVAAAAIPGVLATVGLSARRRQLVATLSGGERARASLAAALLPEPEVLVLDEPTVGLDPVLREELWAGFHGLARAGRTVLVSTHVMDEARECDRLVLMLDGAVLADTTPGGLLDATGTHDLPAAFLAAVRAARQAPA